MRALECEAQSWKMAEISRPAVNASTLEVFCVPGGLAVHDSRLTNCARADTYRPRTPGRTGANQGAKMSDEKTVLADRSAVEVSLLLVRVIVGVIFAAHGAQKMFGAFGGPGLSELVKFMGPIGYPVAIGEFFGGLGLIFGFLSRFSAASLILIMIGAIAMVHGKNGFFLGRGPESTLAESGFEYNLALIGLLAPILIAGPGRLAIGRFVPLSKSAKTGRPVVVLE
jgi:putative oxidoreductase